MWAPEPRPFEAPESRIGRVIFECDQHLKAWIIALGQPRNEANQETIHFTTLALARLVDRDMETVIEQATSGPPRNRAIASAALGFSGDTSVTTLLSSNAGDADREIEKTR